MHARITDNSAYLNVKGRTLASDRFLAGGVTPEGRHLAALVNPPVPTSLDGYAPVRDAIDLAMTDDAHRYGVRASFKF